MPKKPDTSAENISKPGIKKCTNPHRGTGSIRSRAPGNEATSPRPSSASRSPTITSVAPPRTATTAATSRLRSSPSAAGSPAGAFPGRSFTSGKRASSPRTCDASPSSTTRFRSKGCPLRNTTPTTPTSSSGNAVWKNRAERLR